MPPEPSDDDESSKSFARKGEADAYGALSLIISGVLVAGGSLAADVLTAMLDPRVRDA